MAPPPRRQSAPSRPSFRPRPIDVAKPLPIVKSSADLRHEDDIIVARALPTIASGVDPTEEQERHLKQALLASVYGHQTAAAAADIPVPVFRTVQPPVMDTPFHPPNHYILFDRDDHDLLADSVEYDADFVDDAYARHAAIDIEIVERAMDAMEKTQATTTPLLAYAPIKSALAAAVPELSEPVRRALYTHWHSRRDKRNLPFLRQFQPSPNPKNSDPAVAFRPRERDAAVPRRINTYDNYRKALNLRTEIGRLLNVLNAVREREQAKARLVALRLLRQRASATSEGGPRIDASNKSVFVGESEPVVALTPNLVVPTRGLDLPDALPVEVRKMVRKTRRKPRPEKKPPIERALPPGVDGFGFDEHGNKFLKHMRYFAGGFMNYGVSPYDHRVFSAASERNTVRVLPHEPDPVMFPRQVPFAEHVEPSIPRFATDIVEDILGEPPPRKIRGLRVRGRVGRGGRIMLDRVINQRERGVRAASYPFSVEKGGVYTGGLPLDRSSNINAVGQMGVVSKLGAIDQGPLGELASRLVPALGPLFPTGGGWPRRRSARKTPKGGKDRGQTWARKRDEELRRLPAFAVRNEPAIEVDV